MTNHERLSKTLQWQQPDRLVTWDVVDNEAVLVQFGDYDRGRSYGFEEIVDLNIETFKKIGLDTTRYAHDPVNHWMGAKIVNWIRFFGVEPDNWEVEQAGNTAWISKRPFKTLKELERHMPNPPEFEEVREWYEPVIKYLRAAFDEGDIVWVGAVEGPLTDAYSYTDMELFATAIYEAPELISHIMNCTGRFSAQIAEIYAENASAPILFMGEDICGSQGPIFSPEFLREEALPRWKWIMDPVKARGYHFLYHSDGRYGAALPIILEELGADGIHPIERNGCNDIFELRERYPDKLLFGNVCCEVTLPHGNIFDVEDETLELIERIAPEGGICIGSSSEVHDLVPVENVVKMYETVHTYGAYPIDVERIRNRRARIRDRLNTRLIVRDDLQS
jgi:uroporphyrinogen-III decarboxylase